MNKHYLANKKWRTKNPQKWSKSKARNYKKGARNQKNSGVEWSDVENSRIMDLQGPPDRELAKELERTVRAIQVQRSRLRKLSSHKLITHEPTHF